MRPTIFAVILAVIAIACSDDTQSASASCSSSGAAATVGATDGRVFSPTSATVTAGQSVCWQNNGTIPHNVTSSSGPSFAGDLAAGATFVRQFPTAGTFTYSCTLHPGMNGTITVN